MANGFAFVLMLAAFLGLALFAGPLARAIVARRGLSDRYVRPTRDRLVIISVAAMLLALFMLLRQGLVGMLVYTALLAFAFSRRSGARG